MPDITDMLLSSSVQRVRKVMFIRFTFTVTGEGSTKTRPIQALGRSREGSSQMTECLFSLVQVHQSLPSTTMCKDHHL